jgi:hypothetical protein
MKARIEVLSEALSQFEKTDTWWRENRSASPSLFSDELDDALRLLEAQPDAGQPFARPGFASLRRLLLRQTRYWLYYEHLASSGVVLVRALWSAVRGRGPELGRP